MFNFHTIVAIVMIIGDVHSQGDSNKFFNIVELIRTQLDSFEQTNYRTSIDCETTC